MENEVKPKKARMSDYLFILFKWRRFILIFLLLITGLGLALSFVINNKYKATAVVMIPPENSMGLGGLASLVSGKSSATSIGSKLLGIGGNSSEDMLLGILNSRSTLTNVIRKFNLISYYEIPDNNIDKCIKALVGDLMFGPNEYSMIEISVINEDPKTSADIANYFVTILDSINIRLNLEQATNSRKFIEKRYFQNLQDLRNAEDSLYKFQKKYGIVAVPEQLEVTIKAAAEIEAQLMRKEMESFFVLQSYGENSPQYQGIQSEVNLLKKKVEELKNSSNLSASSNILFPFKEMPNISIQYLRIFREVEIQQTILEVVLPLYEQAKVEEQKSMPTIMVLDKAVPPQLKDSPKRSFIILSVFFFTLFILIIAVFRGEKVLNTYIQNNPIDKIEYSFFRSISRLFKVG